MPDTRKSAFPDIIRQDTLDGMHESPKHVLSQFEFDHLPEGPLRETSAATAKVAYAMAATLGSGPELTAGLRHLLEAKDCFVRQAVIDNRP